MISRSARRRQKNAADNLLPKLQKRGIGLPAFALSPIPADVTFLNWVESLAEESIDPATGERRPGLLVDGKPFTLADRPTMAWIYAQVPSNAEEARRMTMTLRKCAQVGFTVMEMLVAVYFALKFDGTKIGMYVPDMTLARTKSSKRFLPIVRSVPDAYRALLEGNAGAGRGKTEGNVTTRMIGRSPVHFLWTSGKTATESNPMDIVTFDEVQGMKLNDMEKTLERMSASDFKFVLMGSTANWPNEDIDYWYRRGSQHRFHTRCPECGVEEPLDEYFPECIAFDQYTPDRMTGVPGDYRYVCRKGHWIDDPQAGTWKPDNPDALLDKSLSIHFHQMLSPTITPREIYEAYLNAVDPKNLYNRKLGKPWLSPDEVPVTLAHLEACVEAGAAAGVQWKQSARDTFMGIDQMGGFNVVIIKERAPDGRQHVIHIEHIYSDSPFDRCSQLMKQFGVRACVVEQLPNFNDAVRFANRHKGRVWLCNGYGKMEDGYVSWGDGPKLDVSQRRTSEDDQARYTVRIDQYKAMEMSLRRLVQTKCLFPNPQELVQDAIVNGRRQPVALLKDVYFRDFTSVALVIERKDPRERMLRASVRKVGLDPHSAFANMLCDIAWVRAHGTASLILPDLEPDDDPALQLGLPGLPVEHAKAIAAINRGADQRCQNCASYRPLPDVKGPSGPIPMGLCQAYEVERRAIDAGCPEFSAAGD